MTDSSAVVAEILETSAAGYASAASALLLQTEAASAGWAGQEWKAHLTQRVLELAASVRVNDPGLFARRVNWLRRAMSSRGGDDAVLRISLECLRDALDRELPAPFRPPVAQTLEQALSSFDSAIEPDAAALDPSTPEGRLGLEYLAACLEARTGDAKQLILQALEDGMDPPSIYSKVLIPAQREVGQLWHIGDINVGEERIVSTTTRDLMTLIVDRYAPDPDSSRTVVLASVSGNAHDLGLRAVADLFRLDGWRVIFLGADMPTDGILHAARSYTADLVVLTATLSTQIRNLGDAIQQLKELDTAPKLLIGGMALLNTPNLWRQLNADGYADNIDDAVAIGSKLIS